MRACALVSYSCVCVCACAPQNSVYKQGQDIYDSVVLPTMRSWCELPFWRQFGLTANLYNQRSTPCTMARILSHGFALVIYKVGGGQAAIESDGKRVFPTDAMLPNNIVCPTQAQVDQAAAAAATAAAHTHK